jgi:hypothetical protein
VIVGILSVIRKQRLGNCHLKQSYGHALLWNVISEPWKWCGGSQNIRNVKYLFAIFFMFCLMVWKNNWHTGTVIIISHHICPWWHLHWCMPYISAKLDLFYMYNEQTNAHLIESLLYCSLFITPTCFNTNRSSSGSSYSVPAKFHKRVHEVLVVFLRNSHINFLELLKH